MGVEAETGHLTVDPALLCSFCYTTSGFCSPSPMQTAELHQGWNMIGGLFSGELDLLPHPSQLAQCQLVVAGKSPMST